MGSVVSGIGNAIGGLFGGGSQQPNVPQPAGLSTYDPYSPYRAGAASQLNALVSNPSSALSSPGYQQTLQQGTRTAQAAGAATGTLQSGGQSAALQSLGQSNFGSYYNQMFNQLSTLSGAAQSPASAAQAQYSGQLGAAGLQNQINAQGQSNILGMGSIGAGLYGNLTSANALNNLATTLGGGGGGSAAGNFSTMGGVTGATDLSALGGYGGAAGASGAGDAAFAAFMM